MVASAVVGGTAAELSGGKFANGAITGAFSRAFNDEFDHQRNKNYQERLKATIDAVRQARTAYNRPGDEWYGKPLGTVIQENDGEYLMLRPIQPDVAVRGIIQSHNSSVWGPRSLQTVDEVAVVVAERPSLTAQEFTTDQRWFRRYTRLANYAGSPVYVDVQQHVWRFESGMTPEEIHLE